MKLRVSLFFLAAVLLSVAPSMASLTSFTNEADAFLKKYVKNGLVDYAGIKAEGATINSLYGQIESMDLSSASATEKKAFYINAYNLVVIHSIVAQYPIASPLDISGFFDQTKHKIAGDMLTLNDLEKMKLLRAYEDARIHFVVVCAAKGCPKIASFAYKAATLESQILARTKMAMNDDYFIRKKGRGVQVSKIFEWYQGDFTQNGQSVLGFVNEFREAPFANSAQVSHYEYDWALNKQ